MILVKVICYRCGYTQGKDMLKCPVCNNEFTKVNFFLGNKLINMNGDQRIQWLENKLGHPLEEKYVEMRKAYQKQRMEEYYKEKELEKQKQEELEREQINKQFEEYSHVPKCPICGSANLRKISTLSKTGSVAVWGVYAAGKVAKTWHCNNCDSEF